jgi:predicted peroxiredoxin
MHFVVSATYGPTDPTRAMLPFIFAASAVQSGDHVTMMLFADSVLTKVSEQGWFRSGLLTSMKRSPAIQTSN